MSGKNTIKTFVSPIRRHCNVRRQQLLQPQQQLRQQHGLVTTYNYSSQPFLHPWFQHCILRQTCVPTFFETTQYCISPSTTTIKATSFSALSHRFLHTPSHSIKEKDTEEEEVELRFHSPELLEEDNEIDVTTAESIGKVAILILNRPKAANAMGTKMLMQLNDALLSLSNDETKVRCVVLTSCSPKVFSAGADLKERRQMTQEEAAAFVTMLRSTFDAMEVLSVPVIAAVEGVALGGGLEIALTADIIVAGKNAKFGLPETGLAIIPGAGGTQRLPRRVGVARAKDLIYTGRKVDADTAYEYGLVQHVVDAGDAKKKALEIAHQIAQKGPLAIRAAKTAIHQGMEAPNIKAAMEIERNCYQQVIPTSDRLEGLAAFREGRKPVYKGE
mmetsp:Transcript_20065/g.29118  ORF Transcript_20065/g.29118 Transcript_20065/m.29118 type:complete len:388 (+) Transcript_20065:120-1283(+)